MGDMGLPGTESGDSMEGMKLGNCELSGWNVGNGSSSCGGATRPVVVGTVVTVTGRTMVGMDDDDSRHPPCAQGMVIKSR